MSLTSVLAIAAGNVAAFGVGLAWGNRIARRGMIRTLDRNWPGWRDRNEETGEE